MNARRLASLLRLRRLQQDLAGSRLSASTQASDAAARGTAVAIQRLAAATAPLAAEGPVWAATVAARAALGSALVDARQLQVVSTERRDADAAAWRATRTRSRAVDVLHTRAVEEERAQRLRAEQHALDEHAARRSGGADGRGSAADAEGVDGGGAR